MVSQFLLFGRRKKERKREKAITIESTRYPQMDIFDALSPIDGREQTNGPHNRKKNIRTPFSRPSFPLSLSRGFRDGAPERFSRAFHTMSHPVKKKKRDGRAFRGRRSGVYVIAGW